MQWRWPVAQLLGRQMLRRPSAWSGGPGLAGPQWGPSSYAIRSARPWSDSSGDPSCRHGTAPRPSNPLRIICRAQHLGLYLKRWGMGSEKGYFLSPKLYDNHCFTSVAKNLSLVEFLEILQVNKMANV